MTRLSRWERRFGWFMLGSGLIYAVVGLFFAFFPGTGRLLAGLPGVALGLPEGDALPASLWHPLAVSMMLTIATCALLAGIDPRRNRPYALPVIVSKATSTFTALGLVLAGQAQASALGVVVTDLPILVATAALYAAATRSVNGSWLRGGPPLG